MKKIDEFKDFKARYDFLYSKYFNKEWPDRDKMGKYIELREKKLAQQRAIEEAEKERQRKGYTNRVNAYAIKKLLGSGKYT